MSTTQQQFIDGQKAGVDAFFKASTHAFAAFEDLVALNLNTARQALSDTADATQDLLSSRDLTGLGQIHAKHVQPAAEKLSAYASSVYAITSKAGAEVSKIAELHLREAQVAGQDAIDAALKNAPAGAQQLNDLFKSAVATAAQSIEGVQAAAKQAVTAAESHIRSAAAGKTATKTRRA